MPHSGPPPYLSIHSQTPACKKPQERRPCSHLLAQPLLGDIQTKHKADSARVGAPAADVAAGVGPQQVSQQALAIWVHILGGKRR